MALTTLMKKDGNTLVADSVLAIEGLQKIPNGEEVKVVVTTPRNLRHHRKFFALLALVMSAQNDPPFYHTVEDLLEEIKLGMGYFKMVKRKDGTQYPKTLSIDFATLDQVAFSEWWDKAIKFILEKILPHVERKTFEDEIYNFLGETTPSQYERR